MGVDDKGTYRYVQSIAYKVKEELIAGLKLKKRLRRGLC